MRHKAQKIGGNLVKCALLQSCAYPGWRPEIWSDPKNLPGACAIKNENTAKRPFSEKHVRWPLPAQSTGLSDVLLVGCAVLI